MDTPDRKSSLIKRINSVPKDVAPQEEVMKKILEDIVAKLPSELENRNRNQYQKMGISLSVRVEPRNTEGKHSTQNSHEPGGPDFGAPYFLVATGNHWNPKVDVHAERPDVIIKRFMLKYSPGQETHRQLQLFEADEMDKNSVEVKSWKSSPYLLDPTLEDVCKRLVFVTLGKYLS